MQSPRHVHRFEAAYLDVAINRRGSKQRRNETISHAFNEMATGTFTGQQGGFGRFHRQDFSLRISCFDRLSHTSERAASAVSRHERVDGSWHLAKNLLSRAMLVILDVQRIFELPRQEITRVLRRRSEE